MSLAIRSGVASAAAAAAVTRVENFSCLFAGSFLLSSELVDFA